MQCIECGSDNSNYNYLCQDCYLKNYPIIETRPRLKLSLCKLCRTPSIKPDVWYDIGNDANLNKDNIIKKSIVDLIDLKYKVKPIKNKELSIINVDEKIFDQNIPVDYVEGSFKVKGIPDLFLPDISIEEDFSLFIKYKKCMKCQLLATGGAIKYKVQIRVIKKIIDNIDKVISDFYKSDKIENKNLFPLEESKLKEGWDMSFIDRKGAEILVNYFKINFGAHIIETKETTSYDRIKNKARYRTVISVRLPNYIKGDIIIFEDLPYQILDIKSNSTVLYNFNDKESLDIENDILLKTKIKNIYSKDELAKYQIISIDDYKNSVQIMNLDSFEIKEISKEDFNYEIIEGNEISAFYWDENLFINQFFN